MARTSINLVSLVLRVRRASLSNREVLEGVIDEGEIFVRTPVFEPQGFAGTRNPTECRNRNPNISLTRRKNPAT